MGDKTKIEWTDASWTPIRAMKVRDLGGISEQHGRIGWHCEHVSEGCRNCYSEVMNKRLGTGLDFKPGHRKDIELFLDEKMLKQPLRWRDPRRIFVCSMTDLFADFVKDEWIDRMFAVMALCPQHTFQILTKRPERMREYFGDCSSHGERAREIAIDEACRAVCEKAFPQGEAEQRHFKNGLGSCDSGLPLPNVWLGTSCEDQAAADERIPHLLATAAAIRFISFEPLLGLVDCGSIKLDGGERIVSAFSGLYGFRDGYSYEASGLGPKIDWAIVGGESGPRARPMHPDWARSLRDQCAAAGVPFFFKQWGEWGLDLGPLTDNTDPVMEGRARCAWFDGSQWHFEKDGYAVDLEASKGSGPWVYRLGKKIAGRTLDGKTHDDFPATP